MGRNEWTALGLLAATFLGGVALVGSTGQFAWLIARASGLAAFGALSLSMILGLLVTTRAAEPRVPRIFNFEIHSFVSVLALTLIGIHGGSLLFDASFHFTPLSLLVPLAAPYAPLWTGLGVVAAWLVAIVTASFWAKKRIGHKAWRRVHYASFGAYVLSVVHGMTAGTDTSNPVVFWLYVMSVAVVAGLFVLRIGGTRRAKARPVTAGSLASGNSRPRPAVRPAAGPARATRTLPAQPLRTGQWRRAVPAMALGFAGVAVLGAILFSSQHAGLSGSNLASSVSQLSSGRSTHGS